MANSIGCDRYEDVIHPHHRQHPRRATLAAETEEVPRIFLIESEYDLAIREAEAAWVRSLLAEITDGTLPGLAQWREFHATGRMPPEIAELAERGRPTD